LPDYSKCTAKFDAKWDSTEEHGAAMCPDDVLTAPMNSFLVDQATQTAAIIAGTLGIPVCGDGSVNVVGEQCDGTDLDGESCPSLGHSLGTLGCDGSCRFDLSDCTSCLDMAGACWLMGADGDDCATTCTHYGMTYSTATETFAGSSGTNANCKLVLDGLLDGAYDGNVVNVQAGGFGCGVQPGPGGFRDVDPTTPTRQAVGIRRACACQ